MRECRERRQGMRDRRSLRPRPEEQHDGIGRERHRREHAHTEAEAQRQEQPRVLRLRGAPRAPQRQQQAEICQRQKPADAHAHGEARGERQLGERGRLGARQFRHQPQHEIERPCHARGEGNVLRVVEHLAVIVGRQRQEQGGEEAGARAAHLAREPPHAGEARGRRRSRSRDAASRKCRTARPGSTLPPSCRRRCRNW